MGSVFLVNYFEFARSSEGRPEQATPESIAGWLRRHWLGTSGGAWNYVPAMDVLVRSFEGSISFDQALTHCAQYWHPHGRLENERVTRATWQFTQDNPSRVYRRGYLAAPIGRWQQHTIYIAIRSPLVRVAAGQVSAVVPVFRKNFAPNDVETNLALTTVREFSAREGYRDLEVELIRAQGQDGTTERRLVVDHGSNRRLFSADEFDAFATKYVKGVALLADSGLGLKQPNFRGYRVWDLDQTHLQF